MFMSMFSTYIIESDYSGLYHGFKKRQYKLIPQSKLPEGTAYSLSLKNGSSHIIKQNVIYLSYPIKNLNNSKSNKFKIEATGNRLNIKPNETVVVSVFAPKEEYENNQSLDIDNPNIEIVGYMDEVKDETHFQKSSGYQSIK